MKKFLSLMGALSLTTVASMTVIACGARVNPIDVKIGSEDFSDEVFVNGDTKNTYSLLDVASATTARSDNFFSNQGNSLFQFVNPNANSSSLNSDVFNVLTSVARKIVKPNNDQEQLRNSRDIFSGREKYVYDKKGPENERFLRPSVDGLVLGWEDQDKYYSKFETTKIASIEGLYKLAQFKGTVGSGLSATKTMADAQFGPDTAGKEFAELFLGIQNNPYREAAFKSVQYGTASSTIKSMFKHYETQSTSFDPSQDIKIDSTDLTTVKSGKYKDVNNLTGEDLEKDQENKIFNRGLSDPDGRLVLNFAGGGSFPTAPTTLKLLKLPEDKDVKPQPLIQLADSNTVYFYNTTKEDKKEDENGTFARAPQQVLYKPVEDLNVSYVFQTDAASKESKGPEYTISFTLKNLTSVWIPALAPKTITVEDDSTPPGEDGKKKEKQLVQVVWHFAGYKFSKGIDSLKGVLPDLTDEQREQLEFERTHRFQDLELTDLKIVKSKD